jgi:hypothetical protein
LTSKLPSIIFLHHFHWSQLLLEPWASHHVPICSACSCSSHSSASLPVLATPWSHKTWENWWKTASSMVQPWFILHLHHLHLLQPIWFIV